MEKIRLITSERNNLLLLLNGFKFYKKKDLTNGEVRWDCTMKRCISKIYLKTLDDYRKVNHHNHEADKSKVFRQIISNHCKRKAVEEPTERPSKIVKSHLNDVGMPEALTRTDYRNIRKTIHRTKSIQQFPKLHVQYNQLSQQKNIANSEIENVQILNISAHNSYGIIIEGREVEYREGCQCSSCLMQLSEKMAGRGRGWMRNDTSEIRRPGQITKTVLKPLKNEEGTAIVNLIEKLEINEYTTDIEVHEIETILLDAEKNNKLKEVFDELHERALDDRQFGIKFAIVFSNKTIYSLETKEGSKLQIMLLRALQNTYMNHEEMKKKNLLQFRNAASLLGEVYNRLRIASLPLRILEEPLLHYMKMLLEICEESDVELVTTQISINGRKIYEENQKQLECFMESVKSVIINRNMTPRARGMLLLLIDLAHQRYSPLSGEQQNFYVSQLGTQTFISIQRHTDLLTVNTKTKNQIGDGDSDSVSTKSETKSTDSIGILMKAPKTETIVKQDSQENRRVVNNERPINSGNVPRAIRGSGATDQRNLKKSPRGKKEKLTDEQVWSSKQNSSSKVWGHDDRFEKDYE